jgi:5-methylcytosine-specific restriction endonuclease McrA
MVGGPRCNGRAETAHHKKPTSQYPEEFWNPENLQAACRPCNAHGAVVKSENRANRQTIAQLEEIVDEQEAEIAALRLRLAVCENNEGEPLTPRIF